MALAHLSSPTLGVLSFTVLQPHGYLLVSWSSQTGPHITALVLAVPVLGTLSSSVTSPDHSLVKQFPWHFLICHPLSFLALSPSGTIQFFLSQHELPESWALSLLITVFLVYVMVLIRCSILWILSEHVLGARLVLDSGTAVMGSCPLELTFWRILAEWLEARRHLVCSEDPH